MLYIIYGLGISGLAAVRYFYKNGHNVIIVDDNEVTIKNTKAKLLQEGLITTDQTAEAIDQSSKNNNNLLAKIQFLTADKIAEKCDANTIIVFSPGIPLYYPKRHFILDIVSKTKAKLMCDIELFYLLNQEKKFLAITGTNGKSTTTALVGYIFEQLKIDVQIGGNIGKPCFDLPPSPLYVFETSSYQLDLIKKSHFSIASLTNITPDHIDRHGSYQNYIAVKKSIFKNQKNGDFAIIGVDNNDSRKIYDELKADKSFKARIIGVSTQKIIEDGVTIINGMLYNKINAAQDVIMLDGLILKGEHNMQNIAIAFANIYCHFLQQNIINFSTKQIIDIIKSFKGLRHRMQYLGQVENINFINDSKATNAESSENALKSYENIFWILGGKQKEGGINMLKPYFSKVIKAYLIGQASDEFAQLLENSGVVYEKCQKLEKAFKKAFLDAKNSGLKEKNILLSPACASFDQWKNFEERGDYFCKSFDEINKA